MGEHQRRPDREPSSARERSSGTRGWQVQLKRELAGLSYSDQQARLRPAGGHVKARLVGESGRAPASLPVGGGGAGPVQMVKTAITSASGEGDHYKRTYSVEGHDKLVISISSGHGYRKEHKPNGPDVTAVGSMDEIEQAIIDDLVANLGETGKIERPVTVNGKSVTYRAFARPDFIGVGTYFVT